MKRGILTCVLSAIAALSLAACSSGGSAAPAVQSAADVAGVIGCSPSPSETNEMFVTDKATCTVEGTEVELLYFSTNEARDSYVEIAGQFGGQYLVGDNFLVGSSPETLQAIQQGVGGEIRP